jgi:tRNA threonylcarbamoyladenosine biosynthesis protein TsaE
MKLPGDQLSLFLATPEETDRLGRWLAGVVRPGDVLLLEGPIGAGKSQLARALIRARLDSDEDVPSPTFTLVQTYPDPEGDIWHADLYRLGHPDEALELGLAEAFDEAICLVEWPDRLGALRPAGALTITLAPEGEGRRVRLDGGAGWAPRLAPLAERGGD